MINSLLNYVIQRSFTDFDECATEIQKWDIELRQIDMGTFRGEVLQFGVGDIHISEARFGRTLIQSGSPPAGLRTFAVPATPETQFVWRGKQVSGDQITVFPRGAELESVSTADFHVYTCSFSEAHLAIASESLGLGYLDEIRGTSEVLQCTPADLETLRKTLFTACRAVRTGNQPINDPVLDRVNLELAKQVLQAMAGASPSGALSASRKRDIALVRADKFIQKNIDDSIRVIDICQAAQVSQRTLEYAFRERYGVTPKRFLLALRLNHVRKDLRKMECHSTKIVDIASRWGFWHMGQFAADYRKQFGELPSQTRQHPHKRVCN